MILAFDATADQCAVALFGGARRIATRSEALSRGHAERLFPLIELCLADAGAAYRDIDLIAVCTGPGNFTGARIGVAAARGLALSIGAKAVGVDRFDAAFDGAAEETVVRLPARGGAAHMARYQSGVLDEAGTVQAEDAPGFIGAARVIEPSETDLAALVRIAAARKGDAPRPSPRYLAPPNAAKPTTAPPRLL